MQDLVSIIIAVKSEAISKATIAEQFKHSTHQNIEVLYISGNRNEEPGIEHINGVTVRTIKNDNQYTPHGFNIGVEAAEGNYIVLCGARSFISKDYLSECIRILNVHKQTGCAGGRIIHTAHTQKGKSIAAAMGAPMGMGLFSFRSLQKSAFTDTVSVPVFRKDVVDQIGLFDESLIRNQDDDYSYRLKKAGFKIWHEASISSTYYVREKFGQLAAQFFQYAFWKNYVNKKHKTVTTYRQLVPAALLITLLCVSIANPLYALTLFSIYLGVIGIQSLLINKLNIVSALYSAIAFITMHFSYGIGYIWGFIYAFILNRNPPSYTKKITR